MGKYLLLLFLIFAGSSVIYLSIATRGTFQPRWSADYFNPLAKSLVQGKLYVEDISNRYDLIEYRGRWYLPWGPLVSIILIPLQAMSGGRYVPPLYLAVLFGGLNVAIVSALLGRVKKDFFPTLGAIDRLLLLTLFAYGTTNFYLSTQGGVWQLNQIVSSFFANLGIAIIFKKNPSYRDYFLSVTLIAMTILGRFTSIMLISVPAFLYFSQHIVPAVTKRKLLFHTVIQGSILFAVPLAVCVSMFFLYNAYRFGNPFDTGYNTIQLLPYFDVLRKTYGNFSLSYVAHNAWIMLFEIPRIHLIHGLKVDFNYEGNSIFFLTPVYLFIFFAWPLIRKNHRFWVHPYVCALWVGTLITLLPILLYLGTGALQLGYRYTHDVTILLILLSIFGIKGKLSVLYKGAIVLSIIMYSIGVWQFS